MPMSISTTTFALDPSDMTMLKDDKICSFVRTYSGVAFFSWGATIVGKEIDLIWNAMPSTMFDALNTLVCLDTTMIWTPNIPGSTQTYEVNLIGLDGAYYISQESSSSFYRINCNLKMLIMSEVT
jgi:hypothetical protein